MVCPCLYSAVETTFALPVGETESFIRSALIVYLPAMLAPKGMSSSEEEVRPEPSHPRVMVSPSLNSGDTRLAFT